MTYIHPEFAKWPSIQRLSSETCYITEKIDGTNAVIYVPEERDEPVVAGSRNRWLTKEDGTPPEKKDENCGFGEWVYQNQLDLRMLGPGYHYGEWYGQSIQRGYGLKTKRFASFEYWRDDLIPLVDKVPVLYAGEWDASMLDFWIDKLIKEGSVLVPGFMKPEGIVLTFKNMKSAKFKKLCENDKLHKHQQGKE